MWPNLYLHQKLAVARLKTGSILCGGVGSGKSRTALAYFYEVVCNMNAETLPTPKQLFIITTARKRDTLDWEKECLAFGLSKDAAASYPGILVHVDSWNNVGKYINEKDAFFIFDEQRVVGSGSWVKSFLKITRNNLWILLSATPGDTWLDYIPVFVANGFYKNRTEFLRTHVVYNTFTKFPKVDRYVETGRLLRNKHSVLVQMAYEKPTSSESITISTKFDKKRMDDIVVRRWNPFDNKPIKDIAELCFFARKLVNSDPSRLSAIRLLIAKHRRLIVFYNFNYELDILRRLVEDVGLGVAEYNGHKHEPIPTTESWVYLVQYMSGAEGWNCIETNAIAFFSMNYSYKMMVQAAGRIDRLNSPFAVLYYYHLKSDSVIDQAIDKALKAKEDFNDKTIINFLEKEK